MRGIYEEAIVEPPGIGSKLILLLLYVGGFVGLLCGILLLHPR
jgi:hypothetical protein